MNAGLYVLKVPVPSGPAGVTHSLIAVKLGDTDNPFIAFASEALAQEYIRRKGMGSECVPAAVGALGAETYRRPGAKLLLARTAQDLEAMVNNVVRFAESAALIEATW